MKKIGCRYCSLYAPNVSDPTIGYCAGRSVPALIRANTSCPYGHDEEVILWVARDKGFLNFNLKGMTFYGISSGGTKTRDFATLKQLEKFVRSSGLRYSLYVSYIDNNGLTFYSTKISEYVPE